MIDRQNEEINAQTKFSVVRCVVCNSFGTLKYGAVICHGCNGKGFIVIDNETGLPVIERQKEGGNEK